MKTRIKYWDWIRSLSILFVVIAHEIELTNQMGLFGKNLYFLGYMISVPVFLVVSGHFMRGSFEKKEFNLKNLVISKFFDILLVWIIWSTILIIWHICLDKAFGCYTGNLFGYIYQATNELWYLWFLFLGYIFFGLLHALKIDNYPVIVGLFLIAAFVSTSFVSVGIAKICIHLFIIWEGYMLKEIPQKAFSAGVIVIYTIILITVFCYQWIDISATNAPGVRALLLLSLKPIAALYTPCIFVFFKNNLVTKFLELIGEKTLYIYILHFFPLSVYKLMNNSSFILYCMAVVATIIIALLIYELLRRLSLDNFFFHPSKVFLKKCSKA